MKIFKNTGFAKQLIIYLLIVLIVTFIFISLALTNSVQQFIGNNAYSQAQVFAGNIQNIFEKEIRKIEDIPDKIVTLDGHSALQTSYFLPLTLLKTYPQLTSCSIHYFSSQQDTADNHTIAFRNRDGNIQLIDTCYKCDLCQAKPKQIIHRNKQGSIWIYSQIEQIKTVAFCYPLCDRHKRCCGYLKLDFPLKTITDIVCDNKLYKYGYLFIIDSTGNYLSNPFQQLQDKKKDTSSLNNTLHHRMRKGETGSSIYYLDNTKYFVYYSPLPYMQWRLGIVCPYNEITSSSNKLLWVIFLCLGSGLLFLFIGTINIVHRLAYPLKELAFASRQIADGHFDAPIPDLKANFEIKELYDSFRYMQQNLINYIEKLKISTAEKEQRRSEMMLARRIQQRFLPHRIQLPPNIELAAELRQSHEVGGDLYDFFIQNDRLYFTVGDVCGKGTPAALYMVTICKLFRYVASSQTSTSEICGILNKLMCEDAEDDMYVTMFMGILDIQTGALTYTNAGHPYPLVIHENGECNFMSKYPDVPIGVLKEHVFIENTYTLHKNTSLLFYTDGITDAENPGGAFYNTDNLLKCIEQAGYFSPQQIIQSILADVKKHMGNRQQSDDLTLLLIKYV